MAEGVFQKGQFLEPCVSIETKEDVKAVAVLLDTA
jgi:hypothetical protein